MTKSLIVRNEVNIEASPSKVWEVLVKPEYIKQWDELPDNFSEPALSLGSDIVWEHGKDNAYTKLTVIAYEPQRKLQISLFGSNWEEPPAPEEVGYTYTLSEQGESTQLTIEIGDFAFLPDGESYYEESLKFGEIAAAKIKELAEQAKI